MPRHDRGVDLEARLGFGTGRKRQHMRHERNARHLRKLAMLHTASAKAQTHERAGAVVASMMRGEGK
eukprot:CAMPEP_0171242422 /NCGR_PEP_ID=MMETSP0790-20130122/45678_1 /TAXON_ID=2925 /ORGANISM="Alexandrium catenella, Strain OF101" /LENGTH=66 /DNA_ID=CAMNT_0011709213 /DNA_START=13 /DNA_END=210 /DNA_ORIENTATION=+